MRNPPRRLPSKPAPLLAPETPSCAYCNEFRGRLVLRHVQRIQDARMTEVAFADLYTAHYRQVRGLCRQLLGSTERAEDAAQEAFVRAYRSLASLDPAQPFIAWIMRIAR